MFTKKTEPTAFDVPRGVPPPAPQPQSHQSELSAPSRQAVPPPQPGVVRSGASHIGEDLTLVGNLVSRGEVQIDGEIQGDLQAAQIVIGDGAKVTGGIIAEDVIVRGVVMGSIRGQRVVLQASSRVEGDIFHNQLAIEQGAYFEGKSRRVADPMSGVSTPETPGPAGPGFPLRSES